MGSKVGAASRSGVAMMLVLALSVVILAVGMSMIGLSGSVMSSSVDAKTKIKARYAAESSISTAIANAVYQAGNFFGGTIAGTTLDLSEAGDNGTADVVSGNNGGFAEILQKNSPMNGMRGNQIPLQISASGKSGSAKAKIVAAVSLYQVPIYQFGVFYDGPLEITPGPNMYVMGRVHTNSDAYFRGIAALSFQGPVTAVGNIYQWARSSSGRVVYQLTPDTSATYSPPLTQNLTAMTSSTQPPAVRGTRNIQFQQSRLTLAIGVGTPHSILGIRDPADPPALQRQKFDWMTANPQLCSSAARWVVLSSTIPTKPTWITGPYVFFDRREQRWVKVWDFDVSALAASTNRDSIFYLDDTTTSFYHMNTTPADTHAVLNAFRIKNATVLPRNMTIACGKPVYVMGNFNTQDASGNTSDYKNAQIASDAVTVLSSQWPNWAASKIGSGGVNASNSSLEQAFGNSNWLSCSGCNSGAYAQHPTGTGVSANVEINAAVITGNKQSLPSCLVAGESESSFEGCYEGGWHNSLRFLEDWSSWTVTFKGSFVCMWQAQTPELRNPTSGRVYNTNYYSPPTRTWGYDTRFDDLANMPPGSPFLATAILTNWLERN